MRQPYVQPVSCSLRIRRMYRRQRLHTVQCHTDTAASHSQFGYSGLEEGTAEVTVNKCVSLFQETVCLVRVRQVGRSTDHVRNLLCQCAQYSSRCVTSCIVCFLLDTCPVYFRSYSAEPFFQLSCFFRIGCSPCSFFFITCSYDSFQFFFTFCVISFTSSKITNGFSGQHPS